MSSENSSIAQGLQQRPRHVLTLVVLTLCCLPFALNLMGVDFSSSKIPLSADSVVDGKVKADALFYALAGAMHHALLEWSAVSIAVLAALTSFLHYSIRRDVTVPIIGMALLCAGLVDAFHTLAATRIIQAQAPNTDFIPFTWAISRIFNASIMIAGAIISMWILRKTRQLGQPDNINRLHSVGTIGIISAIFISLAYILVHTAAISEQLPQTMYRDSLITRPFDVLPLALFSVSGALFWSWYQQDHSAIKFALLLSIIPEVATQLHMAFGSTALFDNHFNIAHLLKNIAYSCIFIGLLIDLVSRLPDERVGSAGLPTPSAPVQYNNSDLLEPGIAKRPLGVQLPAAAFALTLIVSLIVGASFYLESERLVIDKELDDLKNESQLVEPLLANLFEQSYGDVNFLSRTPPIEGIMRAKTDGDEMNLTLWKGRLQRIFSEMLAAKGIYTQIRYIGQANDGRELISVRRQRSGVRITPESRLLARSHKDYFLNTIDKQPGEVYFSKIELTRLQGRVIQPQLPVLRVATPIYHPETGQSFGIVIIDIDFGKFIHRLTKEALRDAVFYLSNTEGDYIAHPDMSKTFGFDLGLRHLIQDDFPSLQGSHEDSLSLRIQQPDGGLRAAHYTNIQLKQYGDVRPLQLLLQYRTDQYLSDIQALRNRGLILALSLSLVALALSLLAVKRLIQPLTDMTDSLQTFEDSGQLQALPTDALDETGVLARSFHNLLVQIEDKSQELQRSVTLAEDTSTSIQTILNSVTDAILSIDSKGIIQTFNQAAERIFQYSESEVVGNPVTMLMNKHYSQTHDSYMNHYLEGGQSKIIGIGRELSAMRKDGEQFPMHLAISEIHRKGERMFTGVIRDITLQKKLEDEREQALLNAQESTKLKAEFLASMSHEIRTPMNGVLGMLGLLMREPLNDKQHHYASLARNSADSLLSLINDILDFSKIEAGKLDLEILDFDIRSQFGELAEGMAIRAQNKDLELILDLSRITQPMVKGDPGRIRQIFTNLVGNAIKFTERGEIIISAQLTEAGENKLQLQCSVTDTGIGIPADKLDELFSSFTQVDASTTRKYGGSGLGLAIVNQLSHLMHGQITVTSEVGAGSCFTVQLELGTSEQTGYALPHVDIRHCPILIVDDNATNREVLRGQLEAWGAQVSEANSGSDTLAILEEHQHRPFKVAILDMQMPGMDGATLAGKIREDQRWETPKMIMMTSMSERGDAQYFADLGFAAYFPKPATTADLFDALAIVLENGEALQQAQPLLTRHHIHSIREHNVPLEGRILLAEDNTINQEVALGVLNDIGLSADVAANGLEVLQALRLAPTSAPYDLILMDCQMPEMDGYEATEAIRKGAAGTEYNELTIIAMTANAMKGDREKCISSGMNDYLSKPIDTYALENMLQHYLTHAARNAEDNNQASQEPAPAPIDNIWDKPGALKRVRNREDRLLKLVQMFTADMPERMERLIQALSCEDSETAGQLAHTIKGVAGNLSAEQLAQQCKTIEQACRQKDFAVFAQIQQPMQDSFQQLMTRLRVFISSQQDET